MKKHSIFLTLIIAIAFAVAPQARAQHQRPDTLRILAIGNSFSEDALEQEFIPLCRAAGLNVIVGNLYRGGCSVERHLDNFCTGRPEYSYRRLDTSGRRDTVENAVMNTALADQPWDIVTFQQASHFSGKKASYAWLRALMKNVRSTVGPHPRFAWHQTWAYAPDSKHDGFARYGCNQLTMYDSICAALHHVLADNPEIKTVIPVGDAIQTARCTELGDDLTRDGYHLDLAIGRYIAACTWLRTLFGICPADVDYRPVVVTEAQRKVVDGVMRQLPAPLP